MIMLSPELLKILACPMCKQSVQLCDEFIVCTACKKKYPVKDDIPIMLIEEAQDL
jgi:uncharacterized protein